MSNIKITGKIRTLTGALPICRSINASKSLMSSSVGPNSKVALEIGPDLKNFKVGNVVMFWVFAEKTKSTMDNIDIQFS